MMTSFIAFIKNKNSVKAFFILSCVAAVFFWAVWLKGALPFPADLLLAEYNPWRHTSYFGYVEGSVPNKAQYFDVIRELYPWKTLVIDQLKQHTIPLWNPYNFSGSPLMANYQSQVWYPMTLLYLILPQPIAWSTLVILQVFLGSLFMYLFASTIGLSFAASILAAILFNYSSFASCWLEFNTVWHTILWIPLILYLFEKRLVNPLTWAGKALFVFAFFSSLTAGHPQDFINSALFIGAYVIARLYVIHKNHSTKVRSIIIELGILTAITFILGAVQILPTAQLFLASSRIPHDVNYVIHNMLIQLWQLPIAISADFFGNPATRSYVLPDTYVNKSLSIGVIGFMCMIVTFVTKKTYHTKFFMVISGLLLILATNNPISQIFYRFPMPLLSTGTPTRNLFIYIFCMSLLAATGFDNLKKMRSLKKPLLILCIVFTLMFIGYIMFPSRVYPFMPITISIMKKSYIFSAGIAILGIIAFIASRKFPVFKMAILLLAVGELCYGFTKFNPFVPQKYIFPPNEIFTFLQKNAGINRFWGYGTAHIEANYATQYHVYSPDGTDPLNLKRYNSFIQSSNDGNLALLFTRSTRSDAYIYPGYGINDLPQNRYRLRVLDALGVRYILDRAENPKDNDTFSPTRFIARWQENSWTIYENLLAAPRYFLTSDIQFYQDDNEFERLFFDPAFDPKSTVLLPSDKQTLLFEKDPKISNVQLVSYKPNEIEFQVDTAKPKLLFLSDTYDQGWKSFVDGQQTETIQANYAFRGVYVPGGTHTVRMIYLPNEFIYGAILSISGLLMFAIYLFVTNPKKA
jgi:Bacterial membrane protein YfhO